MSTGKVQTKSIVDVAKKAGVSVSTASRAMNDSPLVKPSTKKQIQKIAAQLGYELPERRPGPKPGQRGRKKKVAFIRFIDRNHYGAEIPATHFALQSGVMEGAKDNQYSVEEHFLSSEAELPESVLNEKFVGFLLVGAQPNDSVKSFLRKKNCCWLMNNPWVPDWGDHVMPNHREVGMTAAQYLLDHKVRRPVMVKLGLFDRVVSLREEGFFYRLNEADCKAVSIVGEGLMSANPTPYPEAAYVDEVVDKIKQISPRPDGFFMDCDHTLATLYPVLIREKMITPGKTPLIGCNNQQLFLKGIDPYPATMDVHYEMIGLLGTSQLTWRIKHQDYLQRVHSLIAPTLISIG